MTQTTMDNPASQHPWRPGRPLGAFVAGRATKWQKGYLRREQEALAILARLRRGAGKEVEAVPDLWQYTLEDLPGPEPYGDQPTAEEVAAHTALTLFAVHQQSRLEEMHVPGRTLGAAVRKLSAQAPSADAVRRRFGALGTADTFHEVVHHARGLITQLRARGIPLDYGAFADDLVSLQIGNRSRVRLQWGRDFYHAKPESGSTDDEPDNPVAPAALTDEEA